MPNQSNTGIKKKGLKSLFEPIKEDLKIVRRYFKMAQMLTPSSMGLLVTVALFRSITPFIAVIVPKLLIDEMLGEKRIAYFVGLVAGAVLINCIVSFVTGWLERRFEGTCLELQEKCRVYLGNRIMHRDFEDLEDPELLDTKNKSVVPLLEGGVWGFYSTITRLITALTTLTGLVAILSTLNVGIILLILLMVMMNIIFSKKSREIRYEVEQQVAVIRREQDYYEKLTSDFTVGKDIRLYEMEPMVLERMTGLRNKISQYMDGNISKAAQLQGLAQANSQLQMAIVYIYLTVRVFMGTLGISDFMMYATAASTFSITLTNFFGTMLWVRQMLQRFKPFLDFVDIHPKKSNEGLATGEITDCEIEFRHVTFRYPRGKEDILKDVSVKIRAGEKLSVVGLNGAGKTTFIKLLTRLYDPVEGQILLNGRDIREYAYEEYLKLLSVVFQDFKTFSLTLRENIALEHTDVATDQELLSILERVGLKEAVEKLPKGLDTYLYKIFDEEGIELSGGQNQKLAIARAIFKDAPIIVLDEPTAALDPISEFEIYSHFNELINQKTAIYISHRLSSCRFCDRIILFAGGRITQEGAHEELMQHKKGLYYKLYSAQAKHYAEAECS